MIGYFSRGIERLPFLDAMLEKPCQRLTPLARTPDAVMGWGLKPSADKARAYARRKGLTYISLEDAFFRSLGLGVNGCLPHGLAVDYSGIYYDATRPSDLETLILNSPQHAEVVTRAEACMALIRQHRLSKYNHAPERPLPPAAGPRVLVVDQTAGDASVPYGLGSAQAFVDMLAAAVAENPQAQVLVKTHPDVIAGKKQGYLLEAARQYNCQLISEDSNPWSLFDVVEKVYTVTSQLGFEALLAGCEVVCFGMPFYAGWGLTDDRQHCARRGQPRSLAQVFHAACLRYCRYINPYTGQRCELEDTLQLLAVQKQQQERCRGRWQVNGFSGWKRRFVADFLGPAAQVQFTDTLAQDHALSDSAEHLLLWSSKVDDAALAYCRQHNLQLWRMEDGFIRSVGLGADLVRPLSLVLDSQGIYYDATTASDLEDLLQNSTFSDRQLQQAQRVREQLVAQRLSKYNVGQRSKPLALPSQRPIILVPGQVETDASIARGSPQIRTNAALLQAVRAENPQAFIIYKPHPDVLSGGRHGALSSDADGLYDLMVTDIAITDLFDQVDAVHTMSSLSGFEALLRGLPVTCWGMPFYAGWGLTEDRLPCPRRQRTLSLDALIAGALIHYPSYVTPDGHHCDIDTAMVLLQQRRAQGIQGPALKTRLWRWYRNLFEGKR